MAQIKIFRSETYTKDIQEVRYGILAFSEKTKKEMIETSYLYDYTSTKLLDAESDFGKIHRKLMNSLEEHDIVAYHNTRLTDPSKIINNGLIFSDDRYIESLREDMRQYGISTDRIEEIVSKVIKEQERWERGGINQRKNEVHFIFDLDYYEDYDKFLATYGGEFLIRSMKCDGDLKKNKKILKLGKPYIVEFAIPYSRMVNFQKEKIARYMLEEWIHIDIKKDKAVHQYDGRIEFEIPARNIIEIHEVSDNFPDIDAYLFGADNDEKSWTHK